MGVLGLEVTGDQEEGGSRPAFQAEGPWTVMP